MSYKSLSVLYGVSLSMLSSIVFANNPPTISGTPVTQIRQGEFYSFTPVAADADGDKLFFNISSLRGWMSFDSSTGTLSGTPGPGVVGTFPNITISVTDLVERTFLPAFSIEVTPNNTPEIVPAEYEVLEGSIIDIVPDVFDADGDDLTIEIVSPPDQGQLLFQGSRWRYRAPFERGESAQVRFSLRVSDGFLASLPAEFRVKLQSLQEALAIEVVTRSVSADNTYTLNVLQNDTAGLGAGIILNAAFSPLGQTAVESGSVRIRLADGNNTTVPINYVVLTNDGRFATAQTTLLIEQ